MIYENSPCGHHPIPGRRSAGHGRRGEGGGGPVPGTVHPRDPRRGADARPGDTPDSGVLLPVVLPTLRGRFHFRKGGERIWRGGVDRPHTHSVR